MIDPNTPVKFITTTTGCFREEKPDPVRIVKIDTLPDTRGATVHTLDTEVIRRSQRA